jgi:hypothetical protein
MKLPLLAAALVFVASASGQATFPGLKAVLSAAEWKRAGLDRLTPDELGVIDAALIRREAALAATRTTEGETAANPSARFGLSTDKGSDWRSVPPLKAKVVKWETPSRFVLDNNQAWESADPIVYELVGKDIEIQARPNERFALVVGQINTTIRVWRVR